VSKPVFPKGAVVKYSKPADGEHGFRFIVQSHDERKVEMQLICDWFIKPIEILDESEVTLDEETIVLEEILNEESGRMIWHWSVPALGLGGYCGTRSDAISDANLCIGMQCPKIESL
jgi:hypothetical protein